MIKTSYTWRPSYQLPWESLRSCIEKFGYLNCESFAVSKRFMYKEYQKSSCTSMQELLTQKHHLYSQIRYCPKCMSSMGYHSMLHQSKFFDTCFLHPECKLICSDVFIEATKFCHEMQAFYQVRSIVSDSEDKRDLQELVKKWNRRNHDTIYSLLDFGIRGSREGRLYDGWKDFFRKSFLLLPSETLELNPLQRKVCSVSKKELLKLSKQAIQTLFP